MIFDVEESTVKYRLGVTHPANLCTIAEFMGRVWSGGLGATSLPLFFLSPSLLFLSLPFPSSSSPPSP